MKNILLFVAFAACLLPASLFAEDVRNCPAVIVISSFQNKDVKGSGYFNKIIQKEFAGVFQGRFGSNVSVVQNAELVETIREEAKRQKGLEKICDPKLYLPWIPMPEICHFSKEAYAKLDVKGDFIVAGSLFALGNKMIFNATLIISENWRSVSRASGSFTGASTDPGVQNQVLGLARGAAEKFAAEMIKYFYCVENDPKEKEIDFDKPEERKVPITTKVMKLTGAGASGLTVYFSNRAPCCAEVTEKRAELSGGTANTTYIMKKKTDEDSVHADVDPAGGIKTSDITAIKATEGKLCLQLEGSSKTTIREGESATVATWEQKNSGKAALYLNKETATITGKGTLTDKTVEKAVSRNIPGSWGGSTSGKKEFPLTVSGSWVKDGVSTLHIGAVVMESFNVDIQAAGERLPSQTHMSSNFYMDINIPYEDGAKKTETMNQTPYPGITRTYKYDFTLKKCGE